MLGGFRYLWLCRYAMFFPIMDLEKSNILSLSQSLNDRIVCPICREHPGDILLKVDSHAERVCQSCRSIFEAREKSLCFIPTEFLVSDLNEKRETWDRLQLNGRDSYTLAPEFNLSVAGRPDALAFGQFARFDRVVLDVGCGPSETLPSYFSHANEATVIGMDPLDSPMTRQFPFISGIGEYLPFRDETFDHISFASSLDHCLDPLRSLVEARRCLKTGGYLALWVDGIVESAVESKSSGGRGILAKGWKSLTRHNWVAKIGWLRTFQFIKSVALMKVPEGASDPFHLGHFTVDDVLSWLKQSGFVIEKIEKRPEFESVFIRARATDQ
jgi:SAM-dependent methyltransferase